MKRSIAALIFTLAVLSLAPALAADDDPITKPIRYTWVATSCETWNCAVSALILANGDKHVLVMSTGREAQPWVVLRRVEEGSVYIPDEEPYECSVYDTVNNAAIEFGVMDTCHAPMILNVPDGRAVITSLRKCGEGTSKKRAVR